MFAEGPERGFLQISPHSRIRAPRYPVPCPLPRPPDPGECVPQVELTGADADSRPGLLLSVATQKSPLVAIWGPYRCQSAKYSTALRLAPLTLDMARQSARPCGLLKDQIGDSSENSPRRPAWPLDPPNSLRDCLRGFSPSDRSLHLCAYIPARTLLAESHRANKGASALHGLSPAPASRELGLELGVQLGSQLVAAAKTHMQRDMAHRERPVAMNNLARQALVAAYAIRGAIVDEKAARQAIIEIEAE